MNRHIVRRLRSVLRVALTFVCAFGLLGLPLLITMQIWSWLYGTDPYPWYLLVIDAVCIAGGFAGLLLLDGRSR